MRLRKVSHCRHVAISVSQGTVVPLYRDCIGCLPIPPYLRKFQFSLSVSKVCVYMYVHVHVHNVPAALDKAGRQTEALHLLEQLAENAITETRYLVYQF